MADFFSWIDFGIGILYAIVLGLAGAVLWANIPTRVASARILIVAWWVQLAAALFNILFFAFYYRYGGDAYFYFDLARKIWHHLWEEPHLFWSLLFKDLKALAQADLIYLFGTSDRRAIQMGRYALPFFVAGLGFYTPTTVLISTLSFAGKWWLLSALGASLSQEAWEAIRDRVALAVFLLPSALFWTSSLQKETFVVAMLGLTVWAIHRSRRLIWTWPLVLLALHIISQLKPWTTYFLLMGGLMAVLVAFWKMPYFKRDPFVRLLGIAIILTALFIFAYLGMREVLLQLYEYFTEKAYGFQTWHTYLAQTRGQSAYRLWSIPSFKDVRLQNLIIAIPEALVTALYRPFPWEMRKFSHLLVLPENLWLFYVSLQVFKNLTDFWRFQWQHPLRIGLAFFALTFLYVVGLISFNFGALVRYRVPAYLIIVALMAIYLGILHRLHKQE